MSDFSAAPREKKKSSPVQYVVLLLVLAGVAAVAFYQEEINYLFRLRGWDKGAPERTVLAFLAAGKKGDQKQADSYLGTQVFRPLNKDGKWLGYSQSGVPGSSIDFIFEELAPSGETRAEKTEFIYRGNGAAMVTVPDGSGKPVDYRLEMRGGDWKITEIRGGKPHF